MTRTVAVSDVAWRWGWFRRPWLRRGLLLIGLVVLGLLALFPQRFAADVKLAPQDTNTAGLSSILSQLGGNYAALLGNHQPVEIDLAIGRSFDVQRDVAQRVELVRNGSSPEDVKKAVEKLNGHAEVRALRAGIIEVEVHSPDPDFALRTADAYARAMQGRLAGLSREQTAYKRNVLNDRMKEATERLTRAENAIGAFRQRTNTIEPETQLTQAVEQLSMLRGQYQATQVSLAQARRFNSDQSYTVKSLQAALGALAGQIRAAQDHSHNTNGLTASGIAPRSLEYQRLQRELSFSQALYESYTRYLEGASIENLTADFNMQIIEPAFLEPERQFNTVPGIAFVLLLLVAIAAEFYALRPPFGAKFARP